MADLMRALRNADAAGDTKAAQRIATMIREQQQTESSFGDEALGVVENVGAIASGIVAEPMAGLAGIAQSLNPFADEGAGARAIEATHPV